MLTAFEAKHTVGTGFRAQKFYLAKANCHYKLKQKPKMIPCLKKAVKAAPDNPLGKNIQRWLDQSGKK